MDLPGQVLTPVPCPAACVGLLANKASHPRAARPLGNSLLRVAPQGPAGSLHKVPRAALASAALHLQASGLPGLAGSLLADSHGQAPQEASLPTAPLGLRDHTDKAHPPPCRANSHGGSSDARPSGYSSVRTVSSLSPLRRWMQVLFENWYTPCIYLVLTEHRFFYPSVPFVGCIAALVSLARTLLYLVSDLCFVHLVLTLWLLSVVNLLLVDRHY